MTKLQKFGLIISLASCVLWAIGLFVGWNYSEGGGICDDMGICSMYHRTYHVIHFVLIALFAVGIGVFLVESSRKSLKKSCIVSLTSSIMCRMCVSLFFWLFDSCVGDCGGDVLSHVSGIFGTMFIILCFITLFLVIKHLTNSNKWSMIGVISIISLLGTYGIQTSIKYEYLLDYFYAYFPMLFLCLFILSVILCIMAGIKSYKEHKKSS